MTGKRSWVLGGQGPVKETNIISPHIHNELLKLDTAHLLIMVISLVHKTAPKITVPSQLTKICTYSKGRARHPDTSKPRGRTELVQSAPAAACTDHLWRLMRTPAVCCLSIELVNYAKQTPTLPSWGTLYTAVFREPMCTCLHVTYLPHSRWSKTERCRFISVLIHLLS